MSFLCEHVCTVGIKHLAVGGHYGSSCSLQVGICSEMHQLDHSGLHIIHFFTSSVKMLGLCGMVGSQVRWQDHVRSILQV